MRHLALENARHCSMHHSLRANQVSQSVLVLSSVLPYGTHRRAMVIASNLNFSYQFLLTCDLVKLLSKRTAILGALHLPAWTDRGSSCLSSFAF